MGELFLASALIKAHTRQVFPPPVRDTTFILPGFDGFDTVVLKTDGSLDRISSSPKPCQHITVPVMYVSDTRSFPSGAMELHEPILLNEEFNIVLHRTCSPMRIDNCLVLFSGTIESITAPGKYTVGTLPENCRPGSDRIFICSLQADFVCIHHDTGEVVVHVTTSGSDNTKKIHLDNIRYSLNGHGSVHPRRPYGSFVHSIVATNQSLQFAPVNCDLMIPVTVQESPESNPFLSVVAFTQSGHIVSLGEQEAPETVVSEVLVSSVLTGPSCPGRVTGLSAPPEMERLVYGKLSALAFSELSGEDLVRCIRRDKNWRHTGTRLRV